MSMVIQKPFTEEESKFEDSPSPGGNILDQLKSNYLSEDQDNTSQDEGKAILYSTDNDLQVSTNKYLIANPFNDYNKPKVYKSMIYLYEYEDIHSPMFN